MDIAAAIEKIITEHGSAAILRDHLALVRDQAKIVESENSTLRKRVAELEALSASLAAQLASAKKEKESLSKPKRRTSSGELVVDGILWSYMGDIDTHEWLRFQPLCPHCRTRLCVSDESGPFALEPDDYRVRYHCDYDGCGKIDVTFRGKASDREEKAARHILRKHQEKRPNQSPEPTATAVTPPAAQEPRQP